MEFLRSSRRRSLLSETIYVILNIGVAVAVFLMIYAVQSVPAAFGIILLSKWRIFAVRPQYWYAHVVANSVDIIVGLSYVVFLSSAVGNLAAQLIFTALYIGWLLLLKPRSRRLYVTMQGGVGLFVGTAALAQLSPEWPASIVVVLMWVIGYSAARHILLAYQEPHTRIMSAMWGLVMAEVGWIMYHWTIAYTLPLSGNIRIAQVAIIATLLGFIAERCYASYHHSKEIKFNDIVLPLLFSVSLIGVLLTVFGAAQSI